MHPRANLNVYNSYNAVSELSEDWDLADEAILCCRMIPGTNRLQFLVDWDPTWVDETSLSQEQIDAYLARFKIKNDKVDYVSLRDRLMAKKTLKPFNKTNL